MEPAETRIRLFVDAPIAAGAAFRVAAAQAHYLRDVMRLAAGDRVLIFNGRDGEWRARIETLAKGRGTLAAVERRRPQRAEPDLWLAFAPLKRAPIDALARAATELGVSRLIPVVTRHTVVRRVNLGRLRANAIEAAEQCRRLTVPEVAAPLTLDRLIAGWPQGRRLLLADESGGGRPIAEVLAGAGGGSDRWGILVGPEGGLARAELDALAKLPFVTAVGLGPRVLRADTAALSALACWQALIGDWRDRPSPRADR